MAEPVYGIDDFPDDDSLWRVEWIGGVGYNTSVPSDPRITVCLTGVLAPRVRIFTLAYCTQRRWASQSLICRGGEEYFMQC